MDKRSRKKWKYREIEKELDTLIKAANGGILRKYRFLTIEKTKEILYYDNGVYMYNVASFSLKKKLLNKCMNEYKLFFYFYASLKLVLLASQSTYAEIITKP
jgi:hypothetical protein